MRKQGSTPVDRRIPEPMPARPNHTTELVLLLALATLWGASYTFIKVGVATIPPVKLHQGQDLHHKLPGAA